MSKETIDILICNARKQSEATGVRAIAYIIAASKGISASELRSKPLSEWLALTNRALSIYHSDNTMDIL